MRPGGTWARSHDGFKGWTVGAPGFHRKIEASCDEKFWDAWFYVYKRSLPNPIDQLRRRAHQRQFSRVFDGTQPLYLAGNRNPAQAGSCEGLQDVLLRHRQLRGRETQTHAAAKALQGFAHAAQQPVANDGDSGIMHFFAGL